MATFNYDEVGLELFSDKYQERWLKVNGEMEICTVCGRKVNENGHMVWVIDGGGYLATEDETVDPSGDMGWWFVGSECIKPVPAEFRLKIKK